MAGFNPIAEGTALAKEIVLIATNNSFGELRGEMVHSLMHREIFGRAKFVDQANLAFSTLVNVVSAVEVLSDEVATTPTGHRKWLDIDILLDDNLAVGITDLTSGDESQQVACIQIEQGNAILMTKLQLLELVHSLLTVAQDLGDE